MNKICTALLRTCALLASAADARAHLGRISYSDIVVEDETVFYRSKFAAHLIPGTGPTMAGRLKRHDILRMEPDIERWLSASIRVRSGDDACKPEILESAGPDERDNLTVVLAFECPAPVENVRIEFHAFDESIEDFENIVSLEIGGAKVGYVFSPGEPLLAYGDEAGEDGASSFRQFCELGLEHIWTGYDHLLFLLALLLPGGSIFRLAGIVTAFTVAHSLTLALAVLGILSLPSTPVEIAIAASIIYAAATNLRTGAADHRIALTFFFGLIHGFGFAGILQTAGLSEGAVLVPLAAFNIGVEAGQLAVVIAAVAVLRAAGRVVDPSLIRNWGSWLIIAAGVFWLVERTTAWAAG
jgi:hypothetical protein